METLAEPATQTLAEPAEQTLVDKEEGSRVLGEHGVELASEGLVKKDDTRLFETEVFEKGVDKTGIGEVSVGRVSLSEGEKKMSGNKGRKRRVPVAEETEKNGVGKTSKEAKGSNGGGGVIEAKSTRKSARRGGVKESGEGVPENGENIDDESKEGDDEKGMVDEQHNFSVGDLVWGKIKSHPWWPGQIYNPSDASEAATKYKRSNHLLVAYFGDGTFAWCYPSQLKHFQENFEELANQSSMKSFTKAVEAAVDEIGKCLDLEMTSSSEAMGNKPDKSAAVNAGIKEGVAVPDTKLDGLSIFQFEPADFLARLKYIARVVSINNMLDLLVLQHRLSRFYRAKGYPQLPVYHEPMDILVPDDTAVNKLTHEDNVEAVEPEWLSSSAGPAIESTFITISQRHRVTDDNLFHTTKQRSMTELLATKISVNDDETRGNLFVGEGTMSEKETVTTKNRRKSMHSEVRNDTSLAEEQNTSAKQTPASRTRKKNKDAVGHHNDATEGRTSLAEATLTSGKRRKNKGSEVVKNDMADENNLGDVEGGNVNDVAEKLNVSYKQTTGPRMRKIIQEAEIGHDHDVAKESAPSGHDTSDSKKMKKIKDFKVGNDKGTVKDITPAGKHQTKLRKRKENVDSELGNDSGLVEKHDFPSKTPKKAKQRAPMVTGENNASNVENSSIVEEGSTDGKQNLPPEVSRKTKHTGPFVTGENKASDAENDDGGKSGVVKEGTTDGKSALTSKTPKKAKLTGLSVTVENKPFDDEDEDIGSNERSKSGVSFRERKKSKYLSPPYTNISGWKGSLFSPKDSKSEKPKFSSTSHEGDNVTGATGQSNIWSPSVRYSGKTLPQFNASGSSSPFFKKNVLEEGNVSAHEMLSDIRSAALDPSFLGKVQSDDVIKRFFTKFRDSAYHDEHDVVVQKKNFTDAGGRTVSFEAKAVLPSKDTHKTGFGMSEGESERKKRKKMEAEKMQSPKLKSKHAGGTADVQMDSNGDANVEKLVAVLLLTFVPGVLLPSKDELIATFSPCGALKESDSKVIEDSCCAQVVFAREADALEAYNTFENITSFGSSVISYRLRYLSPASIASENAGNSRQHPPSVPSSIKASDTSVVQSNSSLQVVEVPPLASIRQNIETANSLLEKSWDKLSAGVKTSLDDEIRSFLNKVTSMVGSSSS